MDRKYRTEINISARYVSNKLHTTKVAKISHI